MANELNANGLKLGDIQSYGFSDNLGDSTVIVTSRAAVPAKTLSSWTADEVTPQWESTYSVTLPEISSTNGIGYAAYRYTTGVMAAINGSAGLSIKCPANASYKVKSAVFTKTAIVEPDPSSLSSRDKFVKVDSRSCPSIGSEELISAKLIAAGGLAYNGSTGSAACVKMIAVWITYTRVS